LGNLLGKNEFKLKLRLIKANLSKNQNRKCKVKIKTKNQILKLALDKMLIISNKEIQFSSMRIK